MTNWLEVLVYVIAGTAAVLAVVHLVRDRPPSRTAMLPPPRRRRSWSSLVAAGPAGCVALADTDRDVSGVLFVSYLVGRRAGAARSARSGRSPSAAGPAPRCSLLAVLTVVGLELRLRRDLGRRRCLSNVRSLSSGWGRALVFVYGVFAVAATGRSLVQLGTDAGKAPLAYSL